MNPTPLRPTQLRALVAVAFRELTWTLPNVSREVERWRRRAESIPDPALRHDALASLANERLNLEGAALFAILPRHRDLNLLRLAVAYQVALDYLDRTSERPAADPIANGRQLHLALTDALQPGTSPADYYRHHCSHDDAGYLADLVRSCQRRCTRLPAYDRVRERALAAARRVDVQIHNHDPDPLRRDTDLAAFAASAFPGRPERWFELTAASSSTVGIHALLALAADAATTADDVTAVDAAYAFSICAASTLLDSLVDRREDAATGNHSYVSHYADLGEATDRICSIVAQSCAEARALRRGPRHALIAAGVVAMYLSKDDAYDPAIGPATRRILTSAGSLPRIQRPIMRTLRRIRQLETA